MDFTAEKLVLRDLTVAAGSAMRAAGFYCKAASGTPLASYGLEMSLRSCSRPFIRSSTV